MSFLRIKTINGRRYLYFVHTFRDNQGKVKHRQKYAGKAKDSLTSEALKELNHQIRVADPRLHFTDTYRDICMDQARKEGGTWRDYYDYRQKEIVRNYDWIEKNIPRESVINGRMTKSHPPGTVNKSMLYELLLIKDEAKRNQLYQEIKDNHNLRYSWQIRWLVKLS